MIGHSEPKETHQLTFKYETNEFRRFNYIPDSLLSIIGNFQSHNNMNLIIEAETIFSLSQPTGKNTADKQKTPIKTKWVN